MALSREEDFYTKAYLNMPTYQPSDHHAIHARLHDSFMTRLFATKDALYDPHNLFI
jgi:hypothetical protein